MHNVFKGVFFLWHNKNHRITLSALVTAVIYTFRWELSKTTTEHDAFMKF